MLSKKIILTLILCCVFAIGTLNYVDTVEAAKWKKYDSGTIKIENDTFNYKTYTKESNQMRVDINYNKIVLTKTYLTKTKTGINILSVDNKGKTVKKEFTKTKMNLKTYYTHFKKGFKIKK